MVITERVLYLFHNNNYNLVDLIYHCEYVEVLYYVFPRVPWDCPQKNKGQLVQLYYSLFKQICTST